MITVYDSDGKNVEMEVVDARECVEFCGYSFEPPKKPELEADEPPKKPEADEPPKKTSSKTTKAIKS